jgi:PRC-barrel domain
VLGKRSAIDIFLGVTSLVWLASAVPAADAAPPPPSVTVINGGAVRGVLGRMVRGADGKDMGRVVDVIVDPAGQVRAAIVDFGGFLGVGSRKIAVDWNALHFREAVKEGGALRLELTQDQLKAAPEYKEGQPVVVIGSTGALEPLNIP